MQNPDWDDLRVFLTVDRAGSLAGAARVLAVNHSTVLRRLNKLESDLAVRLFEHLPTGYTLTAAGEALRDRLRGVEDEIGAAQRQLAGLDTALTGVVRMTTTDTLARGLLIPRLSAFRAQHPGIELQLVVNNTFSSLTKRDADVALRGSNDPPGHLLGRCPGRMETALYASRSYWRAHRSTREPAAHAWVALDESLAHLAQARWVATHVPDERVALRVDSLAAMVDAVRTGLGVGFLLCFLGDRERDLVRVAEPMATLDTQLWILTHPDLRRVARIRAFTEFLFQSLQKDVHVLPSRRKP
jgi:DNA-binding transcriptional LysR family regulator